MGKLTNPFARPRRAPFKTDIAYPSVAAANVANLVLMRHRELDTGVVVRDTLGQSHGSSRLAARKAIEDTAITRAVLPMP